MASNNAFKITKDTSARKNTRVGSIQSAVEAAAMKESHDYYVYRLTEGYKQQLETMEEGYEEQIRNLKSQLTTAFERGKDEATQKAASTLSEQIQAADMKLLGEQQKHYRTRDMLASETKRANQAEKDNNAIEVRCHAQSNKQKKKIEAELDKAHREKNTGPFRWIEIKFIKRQKTKMAEPKLVVKRAGIKFGELAQAALNSKNTHAWVYEYQGRPLKNLEQTLTQVSRFVKQCSQKDTTILTSACCSSGSRRETKWSTLTSQT
jgi:hypothetical protein